MNLKVKGAILTAVVMSMSITGCGLVQTGSKDDRKKVVAEVNNESILKGELLDVYESQRLNYGITDQFEADSQNKETIQDMKLNILEDLIYQKLIIQKAKEAGFAVTDQALEQAKMEFNILLTDIANQLKSQDGENKSEDAVYTQKAQEYVNSQLEAIGKTQDEYIKLMAEDTMVSQFIEKTTEGVQVSDQDVKDYYDTQLAAQKESTNAVGETDVQLYELPEVRVKHVLIEIPQEQRDEYNKLVSAQKADEAKAFLDARLEEIFPKAKEVLAKAKNGENFEKLIVEYGQDPGMTTNADGYLVKQDGQYVPEFENAAFALEKGEISDLVASSFGYHIIKSYDKVPEKTYSLEEKKEEIKKAVDEQKRNDMWTTIVDEWMAGTAVKKFEDRI